MAEESLVSQITDWLVNQSLGEPNIVELFEGVCLRLHAIGVPVSRAMLMWSTLHPLFQAENVVWHRDQSAELRQFPHQDSSTDEWKRSPMKHMLETHVPVLRRRLSGPGALLDFEILKDLAKDGYTDYLAMATDLFSSSIYADTARRGMFVTWASDRPGGFIDDDLATLQRLQRRLAIACKTVIQAQISRNIAEAYLGRQTGHRVLAG
jgi:adenylate cyclase